MDEQALLSAAQALDENAFALIFDTYYKPIFGYILHHTRHIETAEDLAARVFQRLLEQCAEGNAPERALKAWLFRVAHNLIIDEARRQRYREHASLDEPLPLYSKDLEETITNNLLTAELHKALGQLPLPQRDVLILRFLMALSLEETAQILGKSVGAVKTLQHRALETLRRQFSMKESYHE